jgi:outer membrane protein assembly factor BamD
LIGVLLVCFFYTGCKNEELIRAGDSIDVAYKKALNQYRSENYREAGKAFETVINTARGTDYARSSYFFLAESYFESNQFLLAADGYNRFISLYPQSPKRETAAFKEALSYYKQSPRFKLDQTNSRKAIEKFRIYLDRFPDTQRADDAGKYLTEMRSKLAHKNYESAELYMRLDNYDSAIVYYSLTVSLFPESSWAERALVKEIGAYNEYASKSIQSSQRNRYKKAVSAYEKYLQLFPEGENRQLAEAHVDEARAALKSLGPVPNKQTTSADQ